MIHTVTSTEAQRRGFTLTELLVAMALIVLIMNVLSEAFSASVQAFRDLKAVGDMNEELRSAIVQLRRDVIAGNHFSRNVIREGFETKAVDPRDVEVVQLQYQAIADQAEDIDGQLRELLRDTPPPRARRILERASEELGQIRCHAILMVRVAEQLTIQPQPD